jgi:hypothetical protein
MALETDESNGLQDYGSKVEPRRKRAISMTSRDVI